MAFQSTANATTLQVITINDLPDLCLLEVFAHLPVRELLHDKPLVCQRWNQLVHYACLARRHLTLGYQDPWVEDKTEPSPNERNSLLSSLGWIKTTAPELESIMTRVGHQLANITHLDLTIDFSCTKHRNLVDQLAWSGRLQHLRLRLLHTGTRGGANTKREPLFRWLNSLTALRSLRLSKLFGFGSRQELIDAKLGPLFGRLHRLRVDSLEQNHQQKDWFLPALAEFRDPEDWTVTEHHLAIETDQCFSLVECHQLRDQYPRFRFEALRIKHQLRHWNTPSVMTTFGTSFGHSLRALTLEQVDTRQIHFTYLVASLQSLTSLTELTINWLVVDLQFPAELGRTQTLVSLPSVRSLRLTLLTVHHLAMEYLFLDECFPGLRHLYLEHRFSKCNYCESQTDPNSSAVWFQECRQRMHFILQSAFKRKHGSHLAIHSFNDHSSGPKITQLLKLMEEITPNLMIINQMLDNEPGFVRF